MESKLKGKTVFVTDALRNFGTPVALAFAREGANLFLATLSDQAQLLVVVYAYAEPDIIRVISAWKANKRQGELYEEGRS